MAKLPKDVREALEASGVKFDEHDNIIEDDFLDGMIDDPEDDPEDDTTDEEVNQDTPETDDDLDTDTDTSDEDVADTDETDEETDTDETDNDPDDEAPKDEPETNVIKLTPRQAQQTPSQPVQGNDENTRALQQALAQLAEYKRLLEEAQGTKQPAQDNTRQFADDEIDEDDLTPSEKIFYKKMQSDRQEYHRMRMQQLSSMLETKVNDKFKPHGISFAEITTSQEWADFLNQRRYGSRIGDFYIGAIKTGDINEMAQYFDEFAASYLPAVSQAQGKAADANKPSQKLKDMAVPENTKAKKRLKQPTKYDFDESAYDAKLEDFQRGRISAAEFDKFEAKFFAAEKAGRVKPTT